MNRKPNILIVMTDHQRGDTVLPEHPCQTPNIDRLIEHGVLFSETHCPSPHCCPARATFFTSQYPSVHGVWNNICNGQRLSAGVRKDVRMWSEDLREAGYELYFTGKWHVSTLEDPVDRGWTQLGNSSNKNSYHGARWEFFQELAQREESSQRGEGQILRPGWGDFTLYGVRERNQADERSTAYAVETIQQMASNKTQPWCLYVGLNGPHDPYFVPQRYLDMYALEDIPLPPSYADSMEDKPGLYKRMRNQIWGQLSEREVREGIRHFWAYCTYLDDLLGQMLDALEATGQLDDTLIVYTADHG
ncbi:MAG: choline-sulfatase, partial [Lentisphaerae bacterium]